MIKLRKGCVSKFASTEEKATKLESEGFVRTENSRFDSEKDDAEEVIDEAVKHAENEDLSVLTVKELKVFAFNNGIKLKATRKADIIKEIEQWR